MLFRGGQSPEGETNRTCPRKGRKSYDIIISQDLI